MPRKAGTAAVPVRYGVLTRSFSLSHGKRGFSFPEPVAGLGTKPRRKRACAVHTGHQTPPRAAMRNPKRTTDSQRGGQAYPRALSLKRPASFTADSPTRSSVEVLKPSSAWPHRRLRRPRRNTDQGKPNGNSSEDGLALSVASPSPAKHRPRAAKRPSGHLHDNLANFPP